MPKKDLNPSNKGRYLEAELDELWSYIDSKDQQVWVWTAVDRSTRAVIGLAFGDRSATTCKKLWESLPSEYRKRAVLYTDDWKPYANVLPSKRHRIVEKGSGKTSVVEGINNLMRQRLPNLTRKTCSFSKNRQAFEHKIINLINLYNCSKSA